MGKICNAVYIEIRDGGTLFVNVNKTCDRKFSRNTADKHSLKFKRSFKEVDNNDIARNIYLSRFFALLVYNGPMLNVIFGVFILRIKSIE